MYFYDSLIGKLLSEEILIHVCSLQSFVSTQKATNKSECHLTRQEYGHCLFVVIVCAGTFTKQLLLYIYNQAEELMQCICQKWSAKIVPSI